jgi:hypothetical protein
MNANEFFGGLRQLEQSGNLVRICKPETEAERFAHKLATSEVGAVLHFDLPDEIEPLEAKRHAAAVDAVDLRKFGISDRHLTVEADYWCAPSEGIEVPLRLRVEIHKGARRAPRESVQTHRSSRKGSQAAA